MVAAGSVAAACIPTNEAPASCESRWSSRCGGLICYSDRPTDHLPPTPFPTSNTKRRHRRRVAHRLLPLLLATAATASTLLVDAMAPPQNAFSRGGVAAGVAFQRPRPLWQQPQQQAPPPPPHGMTPIVASPSALLGSASSSLEEGNGEEGKRKRGGRWWSLSGVLNRAQAVAASDDFKVLARGARTVLKELLEVDVGPVDMEKSIDRLRRGVDGALTGGIMSLESLLQMYEGRGKSVEGVFGRVRRVGLIVYACAYGACVLCLVCLSHSLIQNHAHDDTHTYSASPRWSGAGSANS